MIVAMELGGHDIDHWRAVQNGTSVLEGNFSSSGISRDSWRSLTEALSVISRIRLASCGRAIHQHRVSRR